MEGLGDVAQFLQALDVVLDDGYLLFGILGEIVHLANLHYQVFLGLGVRERVDVIEGLGDVKGSKCRLAVERHLQLDACRRIVLQRLGNIVRLAISATVGHRYWGSEIVVESGADINLGQQTGTVFTDIVLALKHIALISLQI